MCCVCVCVCVYMAPPDVSIFVIVLRIFVSDIRCRSLMLCVGDGGICVCVYPLLFFLSKVNSAGRLPALLVFLCFPESSCVHTLQTLTHTHIHTHTHTHTKSLQNYSSLRLS